MACVELPYAKRRVQNNSEGPLGFCHILCLAVSTGIVDCSELILKEKGKKSLRKSFHPLIIQKCPWLPSEGVCKLPHSDSPKETGQVLSKPLTAKSPRNGTDCLGFFIKKSVSIHVGRSGSCHLPHTYPGHTKQVGVLRPPRRSRSHNASRFLKQTQQRCIKGEQERRKTERR